MMHKKIMEKKEGYKIYHINGKELDNRRENLRHVTNRQNQQNLHIKKSSKYPGVGWHKKMGKWRARTRISGKQVYLGDFTKEIDAYHAYCNAVNKLTSQEVI